MIGRLILGALLTLTAGPPAWSAEPGYADSSSCARCHRDAAERYARSGMARSFGVVRASAEAAQARPGEFHDPRTGQDFAVSERDGRLSLRRSIAGHDAKPADVFEADMTHWIGSGNHARTYLSRRSVGRLIELPLTWYSAGGGHWAMSPGYSLPFHAGFSRKVTYGCVFCHAGYPDLRRGRSNPREVGSCRTRLSRVSIASGATAPDRLTSTRRRRDRLRSVCARPS